MILHPDAAMAAVAGVELVRLAVLADDERIRLFLSPGESSLRAVDFDEQIVLAAVADLRGGHRAERAVLKLHDRVAVVVELASFGKYLQMATDRFRQQPGHVTGQVVGVRTDVAEAAGRAALARVGARASI